MEEEAEEEDEVEAEADEKEDRGRKDEVPIASNRLELVCILD